MVIYKPIHHIIAIKRTLKHQSQLLLKVRFVAKEIINESSKIILNSIDLKIKDTILNINSNLALKSINQPTSINSINNKNLYSIFINSFKNIDSDISIKTDYQTTSNKFISKKTSFNPLNFTLSTGSLGFIDKPIYEAKLHKELDSKNIQKASNLKAGKNI
ncbi:hypothetical protein [Campylobacter geochelonis]|uniref:hypothetical protein n=1 Tax=Campylobacter geochelonis TaxID=1780362 RepID=UPI0007707250|nr:hypothetical protein [Campylobacter geochelonis]CZE46049.1 Uncharacterised protein [Campylobacter geochelonis]